MPEKPLNQAIATITGTIDLSTKTVTIGDRVIRARFHPQIRKWATSNMLPLQMTASLRVWPRTNRDGDLLHVTIVRIWDTEGKDYRVFTSGLKPEVNTQLSIIAGTVRFRSRQKVVIGIKPQTKWCKPFLITIFHDGQDIPQPGGLVRAVAKLEGDRFQLESLEIIKESKNIKSVLSAEIPTPKNKPIPKPDPELLKRKQQAKLLLARAKTASNPRDKKQLETLAKQLLKGAA